MSTDKERFDRKEERRVNDTLGFGAKVGGYGEENFGDKGRVRHGNQTFYALLQEAAETHDKKSHDYASDDSPTGNYHFAGEMALLFKHSPQDAGFVGRLAEKIYRIRNIESSGKIGYTETIEDTERDIFVIVGLWMADRRDRRARKNQAANEVHKDMDRAMNRMEMSQQALSAIISIEPNLTNDDRKQMISYLQNCIRDNDSKRKEE
jgi:hypothetical protein